MAHFADGVNDSASFIDKDPFASTTSPRRSLAQVAFHSACSAHSPAGVWQQRRKARHQRANAMDSTSIARACQMGQPCVQATRPAQFFHVAQKRDAAPLPTRPIRHGHCGASTSSAAAIEVGLAL